MTAYSIAGGLASITVGAITATAGLLLVPGAPSTIGTHVIVAVLAIVATSHEIGWVRVRLPQPARQTRSSWYKRYPAPLAATLWGLDVGALITTWFTRAGVWVLIGIAAMSADVVLGASMFGCYWVGRAASVWVAPLFVTTSASAWRLLDEIDHHERRFRFQHIAAIVGLVAAWFVAAAPTEPW